jgi:hypothetical protein
MVSSEEFKNKIENFLQNLTSQIKDDKIIKEIQSEYNELMDLCIKKINIRF